MPALTSLAAILCVIANRRCQAELAGGAVTAQPQWHFRAPL
ncbi:hypothetical protein [Pokkaliibacter plantistimulans]|nr:hypothetical protein [Pokkaliibacter plantistimulans]